MGRLASAVGEGPEGVPDTIEDPLDVDAPHECEVEQEERSAEAEGKALPETQAGGLPRGLGVLLTKNPG